MYKRGYTRQEILDLFRFIDWLMHLPDELNRQFWQEHVEYEREGKMPYVTTVEQYGIEKGEAIGREKELLAGIDIILELKFGEAGRPLLPEIQTLRDVPLLVAVRETLRTAMSLDEVRAVYQAHLPPPVPEDTPPESENAPSKLDDTPPEPPSSNDTPDNGTA